MNRRNVLVGALATALSAVASACGSAGRISKSVVTTTSSRTAVSLPTTTSSRPTKVHQGRTSTTTTDAVAPTSSPSTETTASTTPPPPTTAPTTTTSTTIPAPRWPAIAPLSSLPVGGTLVFRFASPSAFAGDAGILYRPSSGQVVALDTICTHAGGPCAPSGTLLVCPWHGSQFSLTDGSVQHGPASYPLNRATVEIRPDGYVWYVADA